MPKLSDRYRWEAERENGDIIREGGDLAGCVRFSLVPADVFLPRHDICGVPLIRRFGRGFIKPEKGGLFEYLHCCVCRGFRLYVRSTDGAALVTPEDYDLYL